MSNDLNRNTDGDDSFNVTTVIKLTEDKIFTKP